MKSYTAIIGVTVTLLSPLHGQDFGRNTAPWMKDIDAKRDTQAKKISLEEIRQTRRDRNHFVKILHWLDRYTEKDAANATKARAAANIIHHNNKITTQQFKTKVNERLSAKGISLSSLAQEAESGNKIHRFEFLGDSYHRADKENRTAHKRRLAAKLIQAYQKLTPQEKAEALKNLKKNSISLENLKQDQPIIKTKK